jgi:hypothetical protein
LMASPTDSSSSTHAMNGVSGIAVLFFDRPQSIAVPMRPTMHTTSRGQYLKVVGALDFSDR